MSSLLEREVVQKPLSEVKTRFSEIVEEVTETKEHVTVYRYNDPKVVLMPMEDYRRISVLVEGFLSTNPTAYAQLLESIDQSIAAEQSEEIQAKNLEHSLREIRERIRARRTKVIAASKAV